MKYVITWQKVSWKGDDAGGMQRRYFIHDNDRSAIYNLVSSKQLGEAKIFDTSNEAKFILHRIMGHAKMNGSIRIVDDKTLFNARLKGI